MSFDSDLVSALQSVRSYARRLAGQDAEDLLQTAAVKALDNRDRFAPDTAMAAWLRTVMRNERIDNSRLHENKKRVSSERSSRLLAEASFDRLKGDGNAVRLPEALITLPDQESAMELRQVLNLVQSLPEQYGLPLRRVINGEPAPRDIEEARKALLNVMNGKSYDEGLRRIHIALYDRGGKFERAFSSRAEVCRYLDVSDVWVTGLLNGRVTSKSYHLRIFAGDIPHSIEIEQDPDRFALYDCDGQLVDTFASIAEIAMELGVASPLVHQAVKRGCQVSSHYVREIIQDAQPKIDVVKRRFMYRLKKDREEIILRSQQEVADYLSVSKALVAKKVVSGLPINGYVVTLERD